jgi:hypothetical protein
VSASEGARLPGSVIAGLSGDSEAEDQANLLITVDPDGMPRVSLLSRGELVVLSPEELLVAVWAHSHTAANLARAGSAVLFRVDEGVARGVRLRVAEPRRDFETAAGLLLAGFRCVVADVLGDAVPYATISATLSFRLADPGLVLDRWADVHARLTTRFRS